MGRRARGRAELRVLDETDRAGAQRARPADERWTAQWRVGGGTLTQGQGVWWADQVAEWHVKPASRGARLAVVAVVAGDAAPAPTTCTSDA